MDPLTALSVSCNVMQILSFSHELIILAKRIAKDGSPAANLADNAVHMSGLSQSLQNILTPQQKIKPLTEHQQRLQKVAEKCLKSSKELTEELNKIKWIPGPEGSNSKTQRKVIGQTLKFWWQKSKIERLEKEMRDIEQIMQSSILTDLWLSKEAVSIQQKDDFKNLDDRLQLFIRQYAQGHRKLSELVMNQTAVIKEEVSSENTKTRAHISAQLQAQELAQSTKDLCDRLLGSLVYDTMRARKNRVTESHEKTFHWIFDDTIFRPWESFSEWAKSGERIYWISGKPGSGKSTLMKFLVDDQRTKDALYKWAPDTAIVSFFLWNSGTPMQRSVQGLLCALLHQILFINQELVSRLIAEQPDLLRKSSYNDWSDEELELALIKVISISRQPLCIFLDGLDEIDRDEGCLSLADLLDRLQSHTAAKFCISSRPEVAFRDAFSRYRMFQLQDLTKADISVFVADFLQKNFQFKDVDADAEKLQQEIIDEVLKKADGVFLWVHLVLNSLRRGNSHIDSYEQLSKRITQLPRTMEELYKKTWERHGEDENLYRAEAARYFKLVLENHSTRYPLSLFEFVVASNDKLQGAFLEGKTFPPVKSLVDEADNFRRRVESCCGGLLEIWSHDPSPTDQQYFITYMENNAHNFLPQFLVPLSAYVDPASGRAEHVPRGSDLAVLWKISYHLRLDFIHRTAADFLLDTKWGRDLLSCDSATSADIRVSTYRSLLVHALLFTFPTHQERDSHGNYRRDISNFLYELQDLCQDIPSEQYQSLLALLEDIYERLLDRVHVIDDVITSLRLQIRNGQFDASYCKIMCEFIISYTVESFRGLCTSEKITKKKSSQIRVQGLLKGYPPLAKHVFKY